MIDLAHENLSRVKLHLRMASKAKLRVALDEHFVVNRSVRLMTSRAAVLHAFMDKYKGSRLFPVTLSTLLVLSCKAQTSRLFEDIAAMGIMAVDTIHLSL